INEVHYDPVDSERLEEFVELTNPSEAAVDLSGWFFSRGIRFTFPAGSSIPAGGFLVVALDPDAIAARYGAEVPTVGPFEGRLSNRQETLVLRSADFEIVDTVDYRRSFPWPIVGGSEGYSIELIHPNLDNGVGSNWLPSTGATTDDDVFVEAESLWRFFKGTSEPSSPRSAWREVDFDDSSWTTGQLPAGYGVEFVNTTLADMRGNYSTVYLRKTFEWSGNPSELPGLVLDAQFDDGFNVWINGVHVASDGARSQDEPYDSTSSTERSFVIEEFESYDLPDPEEYLVSGTNVVCVQLFNTHIQNSSDAFFDLRLENSEFDPSTGPTPGATNSVAADTIPIVRKQVDHDPQSPVAGDAVALSIYAAHPVGIRRVEVEYQVVPAGGYIMIDSPEYLSAWTPLEANDDGLDGDEEADDDVYTATVPSSVQTHRTLVRYRFRVTNENGDVGVAPREDDPVPNFAYFVYNGLPEWNGAIHPGSSRPERSTPDTYSPEALSAAAVCHLISTQDEVESCHYGDFYEGSEYLYRGTLVYDGEVFDHIRFRARGNILRYLLGKNMWKFNFHRSHRLRARDDFGDRYDTYWDKLNLGAIIQQGRFERRGEQGLFESVGYKLFNYAGIAAPNSNYVHFRVIDEAEETGSRQYDGDFWGLYLAVEQMDRRFVDEHDLPDGNLYKMELDEGDLNSLGFDGPDDNSDVDAFTSAYLNGTPSEAWWAENLDIERYASYQAVVDAVHHYDTSKGNHFFFHDPEIDRWVILPWDIDLTWSNDMWDRGEDLPFRQRVLPFAAYRIEYQNRLREIVDLLYNPEQTGTLIDTFANVVRSGDGSPDLVSADRARWDYAPILSNTDIVDPRFVGGPGLYYESSPTDDFSGMAQLMKSYVQSRIPEMESERYGDSAIPETPSISYAGGEGYPIDQLAFETSAFDDPQGDGTFSAVQYRIAEIDASVVAGRLPKMEIDAAWTSDELDAQVGVSIPSGVASIGSRYRARARHRDATGRWSHWSAAHEFTTSDPAEDVPGLASLRISEIMYHPVGGSEFEFVELVNISDDTIDLTDVSLAGAVRFEFAGSDVESLGPGEVVLVVSSIYDFALRYGTDGLLVAGEFSGKFSDSFERVELRFGGNLAILDFVYADGWYPLTDGFGRSLETTKLEAAREDWAQAPHWMPSSRDGGTPGLASTVPFGRRVPGDANEDSILDIGDAIRVLLLLFDAQRVTSGYPCSAESIDSAASLLVLDYDGGGQVGLEDAIGVLNHLFSSGPPHDLGSACIDIENCSDVCSPDF
ncbi:MAG: lamin tail domain-containing protein, partial [Planctomycetota bacterium]